MEKGSFFPPGRLWRWLWLLAVISGLWVLPAVAEKHRPLVLIINSYHQGNLWSDDELSGLIERLRRRYPDINPSIEYLDAKRFPTEGHLLFMKDYLAGKYRGQRFDLVMALDDPALKMVLEHRKELFPGTPLIFAGIDNFEPSMLAGQEKVTGIAEVDDTAGTLKLALSLHPQTREVFVIHDYTISGLASRKEVEEVSPIFQNQVQFKYAPKGTIEEIVSQIRVSPANALILIKSFSTDSAGRAYSVSESIHRFTHGHMIPAYATHEPRLGHGIVGGILLGGKEQGRRAGDIALRVLAGEDSAKIPVEIKSTASPMFDYEQLARFGIPLGALPEGSLIINRPESFFHKHRTLVWGTLSLIVTMSLVVVSLTVTIIRRRLAEESLKNQVQFATTLLETIPSPVFYKDALGRHLGCNRAFEEFLGLSREKIIGKTFYDMGPPEIAEKYAVMDQELFERPGKQRYEWKVPSADGSERAVIFNKASFSDAGGQVAGLIGVILDITERKRAEEAVRESEELFRSLVENITLGITLISSDYRITMTNPAQGNLFHKHPREFIGKECFREFEKRQAVCPHCPGAIAMATGQKAEIDTKGVRDDGSSLLARIRAFPSFGPDGEITGFIEVVEDITQSKQVEEALRESEARHRTILQTAMDGFWMADLHGRLLEVNETYCRMSGYSAPELLAMRIPDLEVREMGDDVAAHIQKIMAQGEDCFESRHRRKDGSIFNVEVSVQYRPAEGGRLVAFLRDITERKQAEEALRESEERFKLSMEATNDGLWDWNIKTNETYFNPGYYYMLGYEVGAFPAKGNTWKDLLHPDDSEKALRANMDCIEGRRELFEVEFRMKAKNGEWRWILGRGKCVKRDEQGRALRLVGTHVDITERKRVAEALQRSEEKYRLLVNQIPAVVFQGYGDWSVDFFDNKIEILSGYTKEEFDSRKIKWCDLILPEDLNNAHRIFSEALKTDKSYVREYRIRKKDGIISWIQAMGRIFCDDTGKVDYVSGVFFDITERKQAEEALQETSQRLEAIIQASPAAIIVLDSQGLVTHWSPGAGKMFGWLAEEVLGRMNPVVPENKLADFHAHREQVLKGKSFSDVELISRKKDGAPIPISLSTAPLRNLEGTIAGIMSVSLDITARKQAEAELRESEQRFRLMAETIQDVFWISTPENDNMMYVSPAYEQIWGRTCQELYQSPQSFIDAIHPEDREQARSEIFANQRLGFYFSQEYRIIRPDGTVRWLQNRGFPVRDDQGRVTMYTGVVTDITERKSLEDQFLQAQKMEAVGTLAGGIAHDFNNNLMAILGNIGLAALDDKLGPRVQDRLAQAEAACLRAQALSQQLLTFAKGGAPVKKLFSVAELLTESTAFTCVGSPVRCETTFPENLWSIEADPGQIGQVFQNLTINAIQAMPTGGTIKVWAENLTLGTDSDLPLGAGRYIKISVRDQGMGIPAEHLPRIFDPYFTTKQKGSGLGLASTYAIIRKHHGHIAVESKPGVGTTFNIYLPAVERQVAPQPEENKELLVGKGKILVMDDEEMVREVLGRMLARLGYEAEVARDGGEAIEMFVQAHGFGQAFAAVILDLTVPGAMGGKETMARLLEIDPQVKAIVSSGYSDDPIMADFQKYGFSGVIAKPYKISELGKILQEVAMGKQ